MCKCDIKFLYDGTKELLEKQKLIKTPTFLTCHYCNEKKEYKDENFANCTRCDIFICKECKPDLVYNVNNYYVCECETEKHYLCGNHYFCDECKIVNCFKCDEEGSIKTLCPLCTKIYYINNLFFLYLTNLFL